MEWIKTSERNPPFDEFVLCYCRIYGRFLGTYEQIIGDFGNWRRGKELGVLPPTHWQELPLPPQPNQP